MTAFSNNTKLLSEFPQLVGTAQIVKYSPEFERTLEVSDEAEPTQEQIDTYGRQREYLVPTLNRGQGIRFQFLNTPSKPEQPIILLDIVHPGVLLRFRVPKPLVHGVPQKSAALAGFAIALIGAGLLSFYSPFSWLTALGCLIFGLTSQFPGAYIVRMIQTVKQWLAG